jgi:hypothetical protein
MFPGVTPSHRSAPSAVGWLVGIVLIAGCLLACVLGPRPVSVARAATVDAAHRIAGMARAAGTSSPVLASLRIGLGNLHRAADQSAAKPADPFRRLGFTVSVVAVKIDIELARDGSVPASQVRLAERVLEREIRRVHHAWRVADAGPEVAAIVRLLDGLTVDAAKTSGGRTTAEINAFKQAHLSEIKYAGRRWIVDRKLSRQGAVIISRGVRNARLRDAIEQLYRYGAEKGDGGTADALLFEVKAGCRGRVCEHFVKAGERRTQLLRILSEESLTVTERHIAGELVGALTKAIRVAGGR